MVDSPHGKGVTFTIRSASVGYAAEYLTRGRFAAIPMGSFPLMFIYCILYHFWDVRRILLPPPRQFRTPLATASRLDQRPRGICEANSNRSFEFYLSSTVQSAQSSSISGTGGWLIAPPPHAKKFIRPSIQAISPLQ